MNKSYGIFAEFYDSLTQNISYRKRAEYFDCLIKKFGGKQNGVLLDLACGTGSLSEEFDSLGYDVIAVDNSLEMLGIAMNKKFENENKIQYVCQDMRYLDLYGNVDITICALDSLNHLYCIEDVEETFKKIYMFTELNGIFLFDMNTEYKHKRILGNNTFVYDTDDVYCVWQNTCEGSRVTIDLDFFIPENDTYTRFSENFTENAYPIAEIKNLLIKTGFEVAGIFHEDSFESVKEDSQRVVFATIKK